QLGGVRQEPAVGERAHKVRPARLGVEQRAELLARLVDPACRGGGEDPRPPPVELAQSLEILFAGPGRLARGAVGVPEPKQPPQLTERIGVVADTQVDLALPRPSLGADHEDPARLAPAPVAAGSL